MVKGCRVQVRFRVYSLGRSEKFNLYVKGSGGSLKRSKLISYLLFTLLLAPKSHPKQYSTLLILTWTSQNQKVKFITFYKNRQWNY
jgi:hypothetical protein